MIGRTLGHYRILEKIGAGGMGEVYRARDERLERDVAVKVLPAGTLADEAARQRFRKEALALSKLNHPNIQTVHDFDTQDGLDFLVTEYVSGATLSDRLGGQGLPEKEVLRLGQQLAEGLAAAHEQGIIHRDLKPSNLRVTPDGRLKILDFGVAKLLGPVSATAATETGTPTLAGTPLYMAPEQRRGEGVDARSDLYAAGLVLWEMATGRPPVVGRGLSGGASPELQRIVEKCLEEEPENRYQSAKELGVDLRRLAASAAQTPSSSLASGPEARRPQGRSAAIAGLVFLLMAAGAGVYWWTTRSRGVSLQNMKIVQATEDGQTTYVTVSPDGRYLAYVRSEAGTYSLSVRQLPSRGTAQVQLPGDTPLRGLTFSPEGDYIYFLRAGKNVAGRWDLFRIPALGGAPQQVMTDVDTAVSFSPDGRQFAFQRGVPDRREVLVLVAKADGSGEKLIARRAVTSVSPSSIAWSPDGRTLAVILDELHGGVDGHRLELIAIDDGTVRDLYTFRLNLSVATWLPDGRGLLVVDEESDPVRGQIWLVSYPGGRVTPFTRDLTDYDRCCLALTRDGRALAALSRTALADLWVAPQGDAGRAQPIMSGEIEGYGLDWLPDGRVVAKTRTGKLIIMQPDGSQRTELAAQAGFFVSACGNGQYILFEMEREGRYNLWRMEPDGSNPMQITQEKSFVGGWCSPDGKWALYTARGKVLRIPIDGGTPTELATLNEENAWTQISPDGSRVLYTLTETEPGVRKRKVVIISAAGGPPLQTISPPSMTMLRWSPEGSAIQYVLSQGAVSNIYELPLAGGAPRPVTNFASGLSMGYAWSKNGKNLLVARGRIMRNAVLLTQFR